MYLLIKWTERPLCIVYVNKIAVPKEPKHERKNKTLQSVSFKIKKSSLVPFIEFRPIVLALWHKWGSMDIHVQIYYLYFNIYACLFTVAGS